MDWDVVYAVALVFAVFAVLYYLIPLLRKKKLDYYKEVKLVLLLCTQMFRDDKIKRIADIALEVVKSVEQLALTSEEKRLEVVSEVSRRLLDELGIEIDDDTLGLIIDVAVTLLPPTHEE